MNKKRYHFPHRGICHTCDAKRFILYDGHCKECQKIYLKIFNNEM
jgi:hypothetical protein